MTAIMNRLRNLGQMFPGFFGQTGNVKHNHYHDFGYPEDLTFAHFYRMYERNGMADAGVEHTISKTWEDNPEIWESQKPAESQLEEKIRRHFAKIRFWQNVEEADRRSMVGGYAGLIFRFADDKKFSQPAEFVPGGLLGLVEVIPAWAGQLTVARWDTNETSPTYGQPTMYHFNEAAVGVQTQPRQFQLHPSRVMIWSKDGTVHSKSDLSSGYNDLLDMEKISGAGGEGFWKNAKAAPVLEVDKEARIADMASSMGIEPSEIADKMEQQVADWNGGFDSLLMIMGMQAKTLSVSLPSPEHFFNISLQGFAASLKIPQKILVGNQTGERASTEDGASWNKTCMSRRSGRCIPLIHDILDRLVYHGTLPTRDWFVSWSDLTESGPSEKMERGGKMAEINAKSSSAGDGIVYLVDEIRQATGHEPLADVERRQTDDDEFDDDDDEDDDDVDKEKDDEND